MTVGTTASSTAANSFGVSSTASTTAVSGLGSGIDTTAIINALMTVNGATKTRLQAEQTTNSTKISDYQSLNTKMLALQSAARSLQGTNDWQQLSATTSNIGAATATTSGGGVPGSVTFSVTNLASANVVATGASVASTSSVVATAPIFVASGGYALGLRTVAGDSSLALGNHTIAVTQASSGATFTGTAPAQPTTIAAGSNDTFSAVVNGQAVSYQLAPGTYTSVQLAAAIATASAGALRASVDPITGGLKVATANEGSAASLQLTGGSALASLGLSVGGSVTGTDGVISVDGTSTTLSNLVPGASVSLPSGNGGSVTATLDGHLAVGSMTGSQVSVGDGSLSSVVSAINAANQGVSASAIRTGDNAYRLQLSSQSTGANARINVDGAAFTGTGGLHTVTAGADALLHVGGPDGFDVTSATNTITGLMPGVNVTVTGTTTVDNPVTISSSADSSGRADAVNTFVTAANSLLDQLNTYGGYNTTTQVAGDLMGDGALMSLRRQVLSLVSTVRTGPSGAGVDSVGVNLTADGHLSFDRNAFITAFNTDPAGVAGRFASGGTLTPSSPAYAGLASFVYAPGTAAAGNYDVTVTQSATKAAFTGAAVASTLAAGETISLRSGTVVASFAAAAGQSLQDVAAGLNAAATKAGIGVSASVVTDLSGTHLALTSQHYGRNGGFDVSSTGTGSGLSASAGAWASYTGLDVAGTIGGVAATGNGQTLSVPPTTSGLGGLALQITAQGIPTGSSVSLGTFSYHPGVAAQIEGLSEQFADPIKGTFAFSLTQLSALNKGLASQISDADVLLTQQRSLLQSQFNAMETAIAALKSTGDMLTSALSSSSSSGN
jgi:flagellar hook-associated protein 2